MNFEENFIKNYMDMHCQNIVYFSRKACYTLSFQEISTIQNTVFTNHNRQKVLTFFEFIYYDFDRCKPLLRTHLTRHL